MEPLPMSCFKANKLGTITAHQSGKETMQSLKLWEGEEKLSREKFEGGPGIWTSIMKKTPPQAISKACGKTA
ncbi:hypothetical protein AA15669_0379 [Saccharibacter floricola DSM 15669]|uniref:Uncharacterized protein n=1 Tax=Saccharibacter floricola DSM 15669 TaxID=1123227 RepID=A0ABQ0NXL6_9PROT|nr:hypothetical protein AA15669_0379 [Saccharibacter floricola DSM 15669]